MSRIESEETMWAEMNPDTYRGDSCEQHVAQWSCHTDGDMGEENALDVLELKADTFPPGTKVVVYEPICPGCGECPARSIELAEITPENGDKFEEFKWECSCDFDWRKWAEGEYA